MSNLGFGPFNGGNTAVFQEVLATGVDGQVFDGTDQIVSFNTEVISKDFVTLSSDQFTIDAGKYLVSWRCGLGVGSFEFIQVSAYDTVGAVNVGGGRTSTSSSYTESSIEFYINLASSKVIEIKIAAASAMSAAQSRVNNNPSSQYYEQITFTKIG